MSAAQIAETKQYLTFTLNEELFAVEIMKVREVLDYTTITKVPRTPEYMLGVINLRGSVVPVFDMRVKFGIRHGEKTVNTCIIILEISMESESIVIGALVDSVQEVFELDPSQIEPPPRLGTRLDTNFIKGMGKRDDRFIIILEIDRVFSSEQVEMLKENFNEAA